MPNSISQNQATDFKTYLNPPRVAADCFRLYSVDRQESTLENSFPASFFTALTTFLIITSVRKPKEDLDRLIELPKYHVVGL